MRARVSKWVIGVTCAAILGALGATGAANAEDGAIAKAKDAASAATAAAKRAMDAVAAAGSDAGEAALSAAQEAADAATAAAKAAEAAVAAASDAAKKAASTAAAGEQKPAPVQVAAASGDKPYADHVQCEGKDCQIDLYLTRGFRAFSQCQVCHGLDANGSSFAPSLVEKLKEIDEARYVEVVTNGYTGQQGVMPAWGANPNVMKHIDSLYAYLKARSDGVLPPGKLKRYDR